VNAFLIFCKSPQTHALIARVGGACASFLFTVVAARCSSPESLGKYYASLAATYLLATFSAYGFSQISIRDIPERLTRGDLDGARALASKRLAALTVTIFFCAAVFYGTAQIYWVAKLWLLDPNDIITISFVAAWAALYTYQNYLCEVLKSNYRTTLATFFQGGPAGFISAGLATVFFWVLGRSITLHEMLFATIAGLAVQVGMQFFIVRINLKRVRIGEVLNDFLPSLIYGRDFFLNSLANLALAQSSVWIIATLLPPADIAAYGLAARLMATITIFSSVIYATMPPHIVRMLTNGQLSRLESTIRALASINLVVSAPALLVLMLFPGAVLVAIFGGGYSDSTVPVRILAFAALVNMATGIRGQVLLLSGNQRTQLGLTVSTWVLSSFVAILLALRYGLLGATLGFAFGTILQCFAEMIAVKRIHSIKTYAIALRPRRLMEALRNVNN